MTKVVLNIYRHKIQAYLFLLLLLSSCVKEAPQPPPVLYPNYHQQRLGSAASDILNDARFNSLTIELKYMKGFRPDEETIYELKTFMQRYTLKPGGIEVIVSEVNPTEKKVLNVEDVQKIEDQHRTYFPINNRLAIHVLITDGSHSDPNHLGMAYRSTSAVLFGGTILKHSGSSKLLSKSELETSVLLHEMGHLMALGIASETASARRSGKGKLDHCENKMCLMYHATETTNPSVIKRKGKIPQLDESCRRRLEQGGGKRLHPDSARNFYFLSGF